MADPLDALRDELVAKLTNCTPEDAQAVLNDTCAVWKLTGLELRRLVDELHDDSLPPLMIVLALSAMLRMAAKPQGRELLRLANRAGERHARGDRVLPH